MTRQKHIKTNFIQETNKKMIDLCINEFLKCSVVVFNTTRIHFQPILKGPIPSVKIELIPGTYMC